MIRNNFIKINSLDCLDHFKIAFLIVFLVYFSLRFPIQESNFNKTKLQILIKGDDISSHLYLANIASDSFDWFLSQQELMRAYKALGNPNRKIFGIDTKFEETRLKAYKEYYLTKEIDYWTNIVNLQPNYLDGYLKLSLLYFQNNNIDISEQLWKKALAIDPNNLKTHEIGKALTFNN